MPRFTRSAAAWNCPGIGLADAICDLVSSGSTLLPITWKGKQKWCWKIGAVLTARKTWMLLKNSCWKNSCFINAVKTAKNNKYHPECMPNRQLKNIETVLPGMKSLSFPWQPKVGAVCKSVVNEKRFLGSDRKTETIRGRGNTGDTNWKMIV